MSPDTLIRSLLDQDQFDEWLDNRRGSEQRLKSDLLIKYYLEDMGSKAIVVDGVVHMLEYDVDGRPYMGNFCCAVPDSLLATICVWRSLR